MSLFFTSDWHISHEKIIPYCERPFSNVTEMHDALIENYNERVRPSDQAWFLGDMAFGISTEQIRVLKALRGHKHVVWGNHDKYARKLLAPYFETQQDYKELKHEKRFLVLMHFPILSWNKMRHGSIHLHGHCHGTMPFDATIRRYDVGVDANDFKPVAFEEIVALWDGLSTTPSNTTETP